MANQYVVTSIEELEKLYAAPAQTSLIKEIDHVNAHYRAFIEAAPFFALATNGPGGLDCSPRGDPAGFVQVRDEKTVLVPDRRGNNRIDSLRNIVHDPRIALLFLIPGCGETLRINGHAVISTDPALTESFVVNGKAPCTVLVVTVESCFFQCARAIIRSRLWDPALHIDRKSLPSTGTILAEVSKGQVGGEPYDRELPGRLKAQLY